MSVPKECDIDFLENENLDPISFFRWKGYKLQEDKVKAHGAYVSLIHHAKTQGEHSEKGLLMETLWVESKDSTVKDFWSHLPSSSTPAAVKRLQVSICNYPLH